MGITSTKSGTATSHLGLMLHIFLHVSTTAFMNRPKVLQDHLYVLLCTDPVHYFQDQSPDFPLGL